MIPTNLHKYLIYRAFQKLRVREDAEDAVQNAYLLYLTYEKKLDTSNPERVLTWLLDQETIRIWKKNNGITTNKNHGKIFKFADISTLDMTPEDEIVAKGSYVAYNEGEMLYDIKLLKGRKDVPYAKSEYLGEKYVEKTFALTETLQHTKYGTYVRLGLTIGNPKKCKQIKCYKYNP